MLAFVVELLAGLLYGSGEATAESRRGRRLVVVVMLLVIGVAAVAVLLSVA